MVLETERLILRDYVVEDFEALFEILSDVETMQHYPKPYDKEMTKHWIEWNIQMKRIPFHMLMRLHVKSGEN